MGRRRERTLRGVRAKRMSRRGFLRSAGLAGAAAALPGFAGCAAAERISDLPCLATVDAPTPVAGMTYVKASEIGCALDCDLTSGQNIHTGGAATNDGAKINAALAGATAQNPITLIIDGGALISGLFLPPGGYWAIAGLGCGTGFFIAKGSNSDGIRNAAPGNLVFDPGPPAPARGSNVSLTDFTLNCNRGDGTNGDSTDGNYMGNWWLVGINLMNLNNLTIRNIAMVDSPTYQIRLSNVGNVSVSGCVLRSSGWHSDGIHINGPANDIAIDSCTITSGDDAVAFNANEGYSGNIERATVTNCTMNAYRMVRLDAISGTGNPSFYVTDIAISNCSGTFVSEAIVFGDGAFTPPNLIDRVTVTNCSMNAPAALEVSVDFGTVTLSGVQLTPTGDADVGYALMRTDSGDAAAIFQGQSLTLENCSIVRASDYQVMGLYLQTGSGIGTLEFNGFAVNDPQGSTFSSVPALVNIAHGTIGQLVLDAVSAKHIDGPVSGLGLGEVGSVAGTGVLATGWPFPDSIMANGSPYLSANSGKPSIKVNGVVEPYP